MNSKGFLALFVAASMSMLGLGACGSPNDTHAPSDASAPLAQARWESSSPVAAALLLARWDAELERRLTPTEEGWLQSYDGVTSPGWRGAWNQRAYAVGARLPARANEPFVAGVGVSELYRLTFVPRAASDSPISLEEGRAVYADAFRDTDVVFAAAPDRVEWMYVLRTAAAPRSFELDLSLGANLRGPTIRSDGSAVITDEGGVDLLTITRPIAMDAAGVRREGALGFGEGKLTVSIDTTGLSYPVLLDPAIATAVWVLRQTQPQVRGRGAMVYDSARNRAVLFGGDDSASAYLSDTWEWDGASWSLRATTGPTARRDFAMAYDSDRNRTVLYGGQNAQPALDDTWEWDGYGWTQSCTGCVPGQRYGHSMAYDAVGKKTVLFGGYNAASTALNSTYAWNGTTWTMVSSPAITARAYAAMSWDPTNGRVLLFGGRAGASVFNDTWTFNGTTWSSVASSTIPAARYGAVLAPYGTRMLLFGGYDNTTYLSDTYLFNSPNWSLATPASAPTGRWGAFHTYDTARLKVVVYSGKSSPAYYDGELWEYDTNNWAKTERFPSPRTTVGAGDTSRGRFVLFGGTSNVPQNDTWEWTGLSWNRVCKVAPCSTTLPTVRDRHAMAYDSSQQRTYVVGGISGGVARNDTWGWDGSAWVSLCSGGCGSLGSRAGMAMAYDSYRQQMVAFGGDSTLTAGTNATLEFNTSTNTWALVCTSAPCNTTIPTVRHSAAMAFDSVRRLVILFGGVSSGTRLADTWEYDGTAWVQRTPSLAPSARYGMRMTYDPVRKRTVLVGGNTGSGLASDTWEWDGTNWTQLTGSDPGSRADFAMDFDATRQRMVLFGGDTGKASGDTWEYYVRGEACISSSSCSTGYCTDGVCCEQLSCGTCQACNTAGSPGVCGPVANGDDPDSCPAATATCDGQGKCQLKAGRPCTMASQCASGFCADGYCCSTACGGGCDVCNVTPGTCTVVAAGSAGAGPSCSPYVCGGAAACPTTCASDANCATDSFCYSDGTCQPRRAQGSYCNLSTNCKVAWCRQCVGSLACADNTCCNVSCSGTCETCAANPGTCTKVTDATDPDSCTGSKICNLTGVCRTKTGQPCVFPSDCLTGFCVDGYCCNAACGGSCDVCNATPGTCTVLAAGSTGSPSCGPYLCNGGSGSCITSCSSDAQCIASYHCSAGTCSPDVAQGLDCTSTSQCQPGLFCIDGVCCSTTCTGLCMACSTAKGGMSPSGTCSAVVAGMDFDNECTDEGASSCKQTGFCNGSGACQLYASGTTCATSTCAVGIATQYTCDGTGTCKSSNTSCAPYVCATASMCAWSCTSDANCVATSYCDIATGTCKPDQAAGATCASATQCATGNCVDGFCCDSACLGLCQACSSVKKGGGANGVCANVAVNIDPDNECSTDMVSTCKQTGFCSGLGTCKLYAASTPCGSSVCAGGQQIAYTCDGAGTCKAGSAMTCAPYTCASATMCGTTCTSDAGCVATSWCRISDGTCMPDQPTGTVCSSASQCVSGNCVDGTCCDTVCGGLCAACTAALKGGGVDGACGSVAAGTDPQNDCSDDGASSCQKNGSCNGSGGCQLYSSGTTCGATTCAGTTQTGYSCDGLGSCKAGTTTSCDPYTCGATACLTTCNADSQCAASSWCRMGDGHCQPDQANGASCTGGTQCLIGNCVDGTCCDSPCNGGCQACSAAKKGSGADGTCGSIKVDTDPDNECTSAAASTCGQNGSCDGNGACKLWAPGTVCGATTCGNGSQTGYQCDGFGVCKSGNTLPCAPYVCSGNVCGTTCSDDSGCISADWCRTSDGSCQPDQANGAACSAVTQCASGSCVDGFCCDAPCVGTCQACSAAKKGSGANGACGAIVVDADPDNECSTDPVSTCKQTGFCDGAGACKKYASGTTCGSTTCAAGQQTGYQCDGFGTCNAGATTMCAPYNCADASTCATTCASDTACVATAYCDAGTGTCKGDQTNGGACAAASQCISGFCTDGVCCDQACDGLCQGCTAALKGVGQNGVCGTVKAATDPQNECTDDGVSTCQRDGTCNGAGACALYAAGAACGTSTCSNGVQVGYTCNGLGTCASSANTPCAPYVCSGSVCGATCNADTECIASHFCQVIDGTCQPDLGNGEACSAATQCASGNCVDGSCCDSPCSGTCQACSAQKKGNGADGVCASVKVGTDPDNECNDDGAASCKQDGFCSGAGACRLYSSGVACGATTCSAGSQTGYACDGAGTCNPGQTTACSPYVCNGGACGVSCASDADCIASSFCDSTSHCAADQSNGATCAIGSQCVSGNCVDGVCCDQACAGPCQACSAAKKGGGNDGVCESVHEGTDPDNDCDIEPPSTCAKDGTCNGAGDCRKYGQGTACGPNLCAGSTLTGQQCDGFGACASGQTTQCDPFVCVGTSCAVSCADDAGCVATAYCGNNLCQPKVDNAASCTSDHECKSGFCVEGLCCNTACNGVCQACTAANKASGPDGLCGYAKEGADPHGNCEDEGQTSCKHDGFCDGNGACRFYPNGSACGTTDCVNNVQTGYACNGTGTCNPDAKVDCGLYACNSGQCTTTCTASASCSSGAYCDVASSKCKSRDANGTKCTKADTCQSGYCVDGVCCDQACSGQCQACDVSTATGTCSPVFGAPHGSRTACSGATGNTPDGKCAARVCDGSKSVGGCVGFVGAEVGCRDELCSDGEATFSATCNSLGQCGAADAKMTRSCEPYACGTTTCKDKCTTNADCASWYKCDIGTGKCVASATCDGDYTVIAPDGKTTTNCYPYRCEVAETGGACKKSCLSIADCVAGFMCDTSQGQGVCISQSTITDAQDSGGCGCRSSSTPRSPAWLLAAAAAAVLSTLRRRRA
jgi:MYXO-CTERM domain-containing protein